MFENRRHFRLKHHFDVNWNVESQADSGEGTVLNVSLSGLFLQTDKTFKPSDNCVMSIKVDAQDGLPFVEKKGKLMWFRRINTPQERYQCGIQFIDQDSDLKFQQWMENQVTQLSEAANVSILSNRVW